jgi:hypothetical protein
MVDPQKTLERVALLRRHREIQAELAQIERNLREGEARLPNRFGEALTIIFTRL